MQYRPVALIYDEVCGLGVGLLDDLEHLAGGCAVQLEQLLVTQDQSLGDVHYWGVVLYVLHLLHCDVAVTRRLARGRLQKRGSEHSRQVRRVHLAPTHLQEERPHMYHISTHLLPWNFFQEHGKPWNPCQDHGKPWNPCQDHGKPWNPCQDHGKPWNPCQDHIKPWNPCQENGKTSNPCQDHGKPWNPCQDHGKPWNPCQDHGKPWNPCQDHGKRWKPCLDHG